VQSDGSKRLTEERRALIARYLIDAPEPPAGAEREEPMRREALEEAARQAAVAHDRSRRDAEDRVAQRVALASVAEKARRKAADERMRREALEEVARRVAQAEERVQYELLNDAARRAAAAVEEQAWLEAEEARELREAAEKAARLALAAEEEARRQAAEERVRRQAAEQAAPRAAASLTYRIDHELTTRLIQALTRLQTSSDAAATRLERLTRAVVAFCLVIAALTVAVFLKS
jgi:colicin import membrane protein